MISCYDNCLAPVKPKRVHVAKVKPHTCQSAHSLGFPRNRVSVVWCRIDVRFVFHVYVKYILKRNYEEMLHRFKLNRLCRNKRGTYSLCSISVSTVEYHVTFHMDLIRLHNGIMHCDSGCSWNVKSLTVWQETGTNNKLFFWWGKWKIDYIIYFFLI